MTDEEFQGLVLKQFQVLNERFDSMDKKFDGIDSQMDSMDSHMDTMSQDIRDIKLSQVNTEQEIKDIRMLIDGHKPYEKQLERLNATLELVEAKVDVLQLEAIGIRKSK